MFTFAVSCLTTANLPWNYLIHGLNIPGSYTILFSTASDFTSITSHIHKWALFSLWLCLFILSGVISPVFSSSILGTCQPGEFIFQCHILLPFHTVQGLSMPEYWSGLPLPSPVDHVLSELSTMTRPSWASLHGMAHSYIELDKLWSMWAVWSGFCDCAFHDVSSMVDKDKRLMKVSQWERVNVEETGTCTDGWGHAHSNCNPIFCWWDDGSK